MLTFAASGCTRSEIAKQHFEISLRVHPDAANAHDSYGDYLLRVGDSAKAKEMFLKAADMDDSWISRSSKRKAEKLVNLN